MTYLINILNKFIKYIYLYLFIYTLFLFYTIIKIKDLFINQKPKLVKLVELHIK